MSDTAIVPSIVDIPMDFTVVANSPKEMETAQKSLILWSARKIQMLKTELAESQEQLRLHIEKKWSTAGWRSQILKQEKRVDFYRKIKMALEAGYYIVPPFPIDIFAIRTKRETPHEYDSTYRDNHNQPAQCLPAGEGRYVDPRPVRDSYTAEVKQKDGSNKVVTRYFATDYKEVDFPFKLARAEIRDLTDKAMNLKIFDRLGVLPRVRKPDPIVCGQIILPNQKLYRWDGGESINFFVAWWLDTKTL
jgi:hypothetical protein